MLNPVRSVTQCQTAGGYISFVSNVCHCTQGPLTQPYPTWPFTILQKLWVELLLQEVAAALSSDLASAEVLQTEACIRPLSPDGSPIIGQHPDVAGAYIATGNAMALSSMPEASRVFSIFTQGVLHVMIRGVQLCPQCSMFSCRTVRTQITWYR